MTMKLFDVTNNTNNVKYTICVVLELEFHVRMKIIFKIEFLVIGPFVNL